MRSGMLLLLLLLEVVVVVLFMLLVRTEGDVGGKGNWRPPVLLGLPPAPLFGLPPTATVGE